MKSFYIPIALTVQSSIYRASTRDRTSARVSSSASARDRASDSARDGTSTRKPEIIEKFLHPHHLLVHKVQDIELALVPEIQLMLEIALAPKIELAIALALGS